MATSFDRWEKDPFFSAAEEVQDSADRMESIYRQWIQERKEATKSVAGGHEFVTGELQRELHTSLGTAKWQLEEFERAVRLKDEACASGEDARARHSQFIVAIGNRISGVENSLRVSNLEAGQSALSWVRLNEGERDELARFLSGSHKGEDFSVYPAGHIGAGNNLIAVNGEVSIDCMKNSSNSYESNLWETMEGKVKGHRRVASAAGDIGARTVTIPSEDEDTSERSSVDQPSRLPPRILSLSALTCALESTSKLRWYRNGFSKWRGKCHQDAVESLPLRNHQLSRGIDACYERSKSCLSNCAEETYGKQLYGCLGAFQRKLQRSQYQIQYGHPIHIILWAILAVLLIVIFVLRAS